MVGTAVSTVTSALVSAGVNRLLGGGSSGGGAVQGPIFQPFEFGGLTGSLEGGRAVIRPGEERTTAVGEVQRLLRNEADAIAGIRQRVRPGFGELTTARLAEIENRRTRSIGNLRESLARRRIQGSSFANNALIRAEAEFGESAAEARATSLLQELEVTTDLIGREFAARQQSFERAVQEMDFAAQIGTQIISGVNAELGANARLQAELAAEARGNIGAFLEPAITSVGDAAGGFVADLFG